LITSELNRGSDNLLRMGQKYPTELLSLIAHLKKLPGVGTRTAERFAFEFLGWPQEQLVLLGETILGIKEKIPPCETCGCLTDQHHCKFCDLSTRNSQQICILASPRDVFAIEETKSYKGLYHVVEHLLSPLDGRHAKGLRLDKIEKRIEQNKIGEIILAFDSTLEGDTTALYLKSELTAKIPRSISRLAFGLPLGSSLEYIDGSTLTRAFKDRQTF
jgi:recombination protein RecR